MACYLTPSVRGRYPSESKYSRHDARGPDDPGGLSEAEIAALPPVLFGDESPPPPGEYVPPAAERKLGDLAAQWAGVGANGLYELHPDTEPAAIHARQLADVAEARQRLGPRATAAEIADDVILPVWNVERLLKELA